MDVTHPGLFDDGNGNSGLSHLNQNSPYQPVLLSDRADTGTGTDDHRIYHLPDNQTLPCYSFSPEDIVNNDFFYDDEFSIPFDATLTNFDSGMQVRRPRPNAQSLSSSSGSQWSGEPPPWQQARASSAESSVLCSSNSLELSGSISAEDKTDHDSNEIDLMDSSFGIQPGLTAWGTFRDLRNMTVLSPENSILQASGSFAGSEYDNMDADSGCNSEFSHRHFLSWKNQTANDQPENISVGSVAPLTSWAKTCKKDKIEPDSSSKVVKLTTWQKVTGSDQQHESERPRLVTWHSTGTGMTCIQSSASNLTCWKERKSSASLIKVQNEEDLLMNEQHSGPLLNLYSKSRLSSSGGSSSEVFSPCQDDFASGVGITSDLPPMFGSDLMTFSDTPLSDGNMGNGMSEQAVAVKSLCDLSFQPIDTLSGTHNPQRSSQFLLDESLDEKLFFKDIGCTQVSVNASSEHCCRCINQGTQTVSEYKDIVKGNSLKTDSSLQTHFSTVESDSRHRSRRRHPPSVNLPDLSFLSVSQNLSKVDSLDFTDFPESAFRLVQTKARKPKSQRYSETVQRDCSTQVYAADKPQNYGDSSSSSGIDMSLYDSVNFSETSSSGSSSSHSGSDNSSSDHFRQSSDLKSLQTAGNPKEIFQCRDKHDFSVQVLPDDLKSPSRDLVTFGCSSQNENTIVGGALSLKANPVSAIPSMAGRSEGKENMAFRTIMHTSCGQGGSVPLRKPAKSILVRRGVRSACLPSEMVSLTLMSNLSTCHAIASSADSGLHLTAVSSMDSQSTDKELCAQSNETQQKSVTFSDNVIFCTTPESGVSSPKVTIADAAVDLPVDAASDADDDLPPNNFSIASMPRCRSLQTMKEAATDSSVNMSNKQDLVTDVIVAVNLLRNHFCQAKEPVSRTKMGNTSRNDEIGQLVLRHLCPAIHAVLLDGLKSHLHTFFGKVKNSAWKVMENSIKMDAMYQKLLAEVKKCEDIKTPWLLFNSFIFALLNHKALDIWLLHLYTQKSLLRQHYTSAGFLSLDGPGSTGRQLYLRLVAAVRPLARLPFRLDLDYEHRLLCQQEEFVDRSSSVHSLPLPEFGPSFVGERGMARLMRSAVSSIGGRTSQSVNHAKKFITSSLSLSSMVDFGIASSRLALQSLSDHMDRHKSETDSGFESALLSGNDECLTSAVGVGSTAGCKQEAKDCPRNCSNDSDADPITINGHLPVKPKCNQKAVSSADRGSLAVQFSRVGAVGSQFVSVASKVLLQEPDHWLRLYRHVVAKPASFVYSLAFRSATQQSQSNSQFSSQPAWSEELKDRMTTVQSDMTSGSSQQMESDNRCSTESSTLASVQTLCHYVATDADELSFSKGEQLQLLLPDDVNNGCEWLLCRHGNQEGLVHRGCVRVCC